jgi:hypothetical protein
MEIGKAIKTLLNAAGINCYAEAAPQQVTGDTVVYSVISDVPTTSKGNTSKIDTYRVQVNSYSNTYPKVVLLAGYVRAALDNKSGSIGGLTVDGIYFNNLQGGFELEPNNYVVTQDYMIRIKL